MEKRDCAKIVGLALFLTLVYPLNVGAIGPIDTDFSFGQMFFGWNTNFFGHNVKSDYTGFPDDLHQSSGFKQRLDQVYGDASLSEDIDVLVDVIPVGERALNDSIEERIEAVHKRKGVRVEVYERQSSFSEEEFREKYDSDAGKILGSHGGYNGFVEDEVSESMQGAAIQVVLAPGNEGEMEGWLTYDEMYRGGFALGSQVVLGSDEAFKQRYGPRYREGKTLALVHEIGHSYGLEHSNISSEIMNPDVNLEASPEYTEKEWEKIRKTLNG